MIFVGEEALDHTLSLEADERSCNKVSCKFNVRICISETRGVNIFRPQFPPYLPARTSCSCTRHG